MKMMKHLLSILLCLAVLLAVLPFGVWAEETETPVAEGYTRVYCQAPSSRSICKVYWWVRANFNP